MLYPEYVGVLKKVLMRFLKFEVVSGKSNSKLINIDCDNLDNCKSLKDMTIGQEVCDGLSKLEGDRQKAVQIDMRTFYQQVSKHLSKKLPLHESVVKTAQCLPNVCPMSAQCLPNVCPMSAQCLPNVCTKKSKTKITH